MNWRPVFGSNDTYIFTVSPTARQIEIRGFGYWGILGILSLQEYSYITGSWDDLPGYSWTEDFLTTLDVIPGYQYRLSLVLAVIPNLVVSIFEI